VPEGHTIHRLAADHTRLLAGRAVRVSSPQGRFAGDAARVDGAVLLSVEAYGKHLFHHWDTGDVTHVHLGLFGKFRTWRGVPIPEPRGAVRMRMATDDVAVDLSGPTDCSVGDPSTRDAIVGRLGPDPLRRDARPDLAIDRMRRSARPLGALLLDQAVVAGIGNVYRAEVLFVHGIHPLRPGRDTDRADLEQIWSTMATMLRAGVKANRIVTVRREDLDLPRGARVPRGRATYVYKRDHCLRCGSEIRTLEVANRTCYYCPVDQPA
jgi:endonuclease-8